MNDSIEEKYKMVQTTLEDTMKGMNSIQLNGDEENMELKEISSVLEEINLEFKQEIEKLEKSSEWEKYCIAFFGETNAGKSTIIESLRIIFNEEQRRAELIKQEKEYLFDLSKHCDDYNNLLSKLKEINNSLNTRKKANMSPMLLRNLLYILAGAVIGYIISFYGLI